MPNGPENPTHFAKKVEAWSRPAAIAFANPGRRADAVAFYTRQKVITERWFGAEGPKDGWV
jgi:hypothetical protein